MNILILTLLIVLSVFPAQAQRRKAEAIKPCTLTVDQIPEVRGLRLGQSYEYLTTTIPRKHDLDASPDEYGLRRVLLHPATLESPDKLSGISHVWLDYFDDSLRSIEISYKREVKWQSNLHFVAAIVDRLNLPRDGWLNGDPAYLFCRGFSVQVAYSNNLKIIDLMFVEEVQKRKTEVESRKRAQFRP